MRIAILGAGYTGAQLGRALAQGGHEVVLVARNRSRLETLVAEIGDRAVARSASTEDPPALEVALGDADRLVHLAPPPREAVPEDAAAAVLRALARGCERVVYGSTTGVFETPDDPEEWVDEEWPAGPRGRLGRRRWGYEKGLLENAAAPVHIVRIAGIYGPGRTLLERLRDGKLLLSEGARPTSRIHRDDLARILTAVVLAERPPPLVVACDELPAPTLDVARYTARLSGLPEPSVSPADVVERQLSPIALEFRQNAKRCRSIYRASLSGALLYPTYREGVAASLGLPPPG